MLYIEWYRCEYDVWCDLFRLDLDHKYLKSLNGVYIIWSGEDDSRSFLRVGSGDIQKELKKHRNDIAMNAFSHLGVHVTWAEVSAFKRKNVQSFLAKELKPKFMDNVPDSTPLKVNLPWDESL